MSRHIKDTKQLRLDQPLLYLRLQVAQFKLHSGDIAGCKSIIEEGKDELEAMSDVSLRIIAGRLVQATSRAHCWEILPAGCLQAQCNPPQRRSLLQVDPDVSAAYYFNRSLLFKQQKDFAEFYKSSLLYLAFISSEALPQDVKLVGIPALHCCFELITCFSMHAFKGVRPCDVTQSLAVDISLAALLGDNVYNFGELLLHPMVSCICSVH